eukprot:1159705-Pelagomonas_calceolata.AAC.6
MEAHMLPALQVRLYLGGKGPEGQGMSVKVLAKEAYGPEHAGVPRRTKNACVNALIDSMHTSYDCAGNARVSASMDLMQAF